MYSNGFIFFLKSLEYGYTRLQDAPLDTIGALEGAAKIPLHHDFEPQRVQLGVDLLKGQIHAPHTGQFSAFLRLMVSKL